VVFGVTDVANAVSLLAARGESLDSCEKNADMIHSGSS